MELSERQQDVQDTWINTDHNILVNSVAGSGKTTLLLNLIKHCDDKTLMLAFNKSIQRELEDATTGMNNIKTMTLHGLGLMAIKQSVGNHIKVNKNKSWVINNKLRELIPGYFKTVKWKTQIEITAYLSFLNDTARMFITEDLSEIKRYMKVMGKPVIPIPYREIRPNQKEVEEFQKEDSIYTKIEDRYGRPCYQINEEILWGLYLQIRNSIQNEIDFLDMIYIPVVMDLDIPMKPVYMTIDEAQDLNYCQHQLINKIIEQPQFKKWVSVGDYRQSIYSFAGALSNSFDMFKEKDNVVEKDLDICYRCSKLVINQANSIYNVMRGFKEEEGFLLHTDSIKETMFETSSMVVCRNQAPLVGLFFYLASNEIPCYLKGEDFMASTINYLKPFKNQKFREHIAELRVEAIKLQDSTSQNDRIRYFYLKEKYDILLLISQNLILDNPFIKEVIPKLQILFENRPDAITLSTIHKSKGLEAETVYWLYPELIPSKFAFSEDQLRQEENLKYVAVTRAKSKLIIIHQKTKEDEF